ncbi:oxidoreductase [Acuticoccus sp. M5D2P5]|uniref:oxidoreductase n=1 Tax=Acuticoccus kalidii TaxID=2910977 RepID=UPI001F480F40|nr:oxidoreductase [Acuticoccus kalidii]MCF3934322.1 oxidoreductase [Acuticoccus kalidii]
MTVDLSNVVDPIASMVDAAIEAAHNEEERTYLGASVIGDPCERKLWYGFRWALEAEKFSGRMLRLFETGHLEEARMIEWLRAIGINVTDRDEETGKQLAISDIGGHFRGHLDGEAIGDPRAPMTVHVTEFKTANAKSFAEMKRHGVEVAKPMHAAQMQVYMEKRGRSRALYVMKCKDNEELHSERLKHDATRALNLLAKAERIVVADEPPARIADNEDDFRCRFCHAKAFCHSGGWARRNCRTCLHSEPRMNGDGLWWCCRHECELSADMQRAGCELHRYLPGLVPGTPVDADEATETVSYELADGSIWTDGELRA